MIKNILKNIRRDGVRVTVIQILIKLLGLSNYIFLHNDKLDSVIKEKMHATGTSLRNNDPNYVIRQLDDVQLIFTKLSGREIKKKAIANKSETFLSVNSYVTNLLAEYGTFLHTTSSKTQEDINRVFNIALEIDENNEPNICKAYIKYLWKYEYSSDKLIEVLNRFETYSNNKKRYLTDTYLIHMCVLLEYGYRDKCFEVLKQFVKLWGRKSIHNYLPVAKFAHDLGITNDRINKSAQVFQAQEKNLGLLEHYVKDKSIAIVGSSPNELGTGNGDDIDSHDIVIRFNTYQLESYEIDYGTKTNVWLRNMNVSMDARYEEIENYEMILSEADIWHYKFGDNLIDILYNYINKSETPLVYLKHRDELINKINVFPTSGALLLYNLFKLKDTFRCLDVYGFSFFDCMSKENINNDFSHYFDQSNTDKSDCMPPDALHHNKSLEDKYLLSIYKQMNEKTGAN